MVVKKRFYILNASAKLKIEFSVLHVRDMATDAKMFSLFCEGNALGRTLNSHSISLGLVSENTLEQLDTTGLKPRDVRVTIRYYFDLIHFL